MIEGGVISLKDKSSKVALVYGQMNEPPGRRARTCCSSLTTSSGSPRPALRCLLCSDVSHLLSVTSQLLPLTWVPCRSVSPPPRRDPSHLCRLSMCPLMT